MPGSYVDSEDPKSVFMLVPKALYSLIPLPGPQALVHSSTFPHSPPCKTVEAGVLRILPTSKSEKSCFSKNHTLDWIALPWGTPRSIHAVSEHDMPLAP